MWVSYNNNLLSIFVLGAKPSADSFYLKPQYARLVLQL
ncbi:hypothetical protein VS85_00457 [Vibrio cholerae]|nr:hypothetical protein VCHC61A1_2272 [Vibrio cholerae HC-61A1]KKP17989.1 hypothetical protein VS85_00457 [Vibrio cholerae]